MTSKKEIIIREHRRNPYASYAELARIIQRKGVNVADGYVRDVLKKEGVSISKARNSHQIPASAAVHIEQSVVSTAKASSEAISDQPVETRILAAQNPDSSPDVLAELVTDPDFRVRIALARRDEVTPKILENLIRTFGGDGDVNDDDYYDDWDDDEYWQLMEEIAENPNVDEETLWDLIS